MIAVSHTTRFLYLIAIKIDSLSGQVFKKVFIPTAVYEKLTDEKNTGTCPSPDVVPPCLVGGL
jgi:predicted nucleic acid-binding protein